MSEGLSVCDLHRVWFDNKHCVFCVQDQRIKELESDLLRARDLAVGIDARLVAADDKLAEAHALINEAEKRLQNLNHLFELWEKGPLARAGIIWDTHPPAVILAKEILDKIKAWKEGK